MCITPKSISQLGPRENNQESPHPEVLGLCLKPPAHRLGMLCCVPTRPSTLLSTELAANSTAELILSHCLGEKSVPHKRLLFTEEGNAFF